MKRKNLICIGSDEGGAFRNDEGTFAQFSTGLLVNLLALDYEKVVWCAPYERAEPGRCATKLADNVRFVESPEYQPNQTQTFVRRDKFRDSWKNALAEPGDVFILGRFPAVAELYDLCAAARCKTLHWLSSDPFAQIDAGGLGAFVGQKLAFFNATQWENAVKRGVDKTQGAFLCAGREIFERMDGYDRFEFAAAPIRESDFAWRDDVCQGETIRVLFVGRVCPKNGLEFLFDAVPLLKTERRIELICVGEKTSSDAKYHALLDKIIRKNNLQDRVSFLGRVERDVLFDTMRQSDVFVFPALAAGTPYVVVEARSQGLPTIASDVGGIPSSIDDGVDGLLVPPGDPAMIADAIDCVVGDVDLRRGLVTEGYESAKAMTFESLALKIVEIFDEMNGREDAEPSE